MATPAQFSVLGPLKSGVETRAFLGCEVVDGVPRPDRPVVVVWLPDDVVSDPKQVARLQRETAFVTQLHHPNIIGVRGLECFEEGWARVVDFVDGEPLIRVLTRAQEEFRPVAPRVAARMILDVCEAVSYAHEEGQARFAGRPVVHGGLRPDTLMLTFSGRTTVTGYGASVLAPTQHGTPMKDKFVYFAPEQIIGGKATASPATDIYAIGAVLYELLAGKPPFSDAEDVERAVLTGEPPLLDAPGLAGLLGNVAATALAKRGSERFETVEFMREAILAALAKEGVEPATHEDVADFVNALIPEDAPERVSRQELLESAEDPDVATILSPSENTPEGVDPSLYARSRPTSGVLRAAPRREEVTQVNAAAPAEEAEAPIVRKALPREVDTLIEAPRDVAAPVPVTMDDEPTMGDAPLAATESAVAAALPVVPLPPVGAASADLIAPPPAAPVPQAPAPQATWPQPGLPAPVPQAPAPQAAMPPASMPQFQAPVPQPQASMPQFQAPVPQPQASMPQFQAPVPQAPQPPLPQYGVPGYPPGVVPPGYPQPYPSGPVPQAAYPQGMFPPGTQPPPPGAYPGFQPQGAYPPGTQPPPSYPSQVPPRAGWPAGQPPSGAFPAGATPPGTAPPPGTGRPTPRGFAPPASRSNPTPDLLANAPVQGLPPAPPKKSTAIRENSQVTQFNKRMGDSSRSVIFLILAAALAAGVFIFMSKEPPEGLDAPPERHTLPKELVQAALQNAGKDNGEVLDDGAGKADEAAAEAAAAALDGGLAPEVATTDPAAPPAPPPPGHLQISSDPEVSVFLGKENLGRTPINTDLPPGRHRLRFTDAKTGINIYKTFRVRPGAKHHHDLSFGTSQLVVLAPEGAVVSLNVKKLGTAPIEPVTIYEGEYLLKVTYNGMSWSERFDAPAGQRIEYKVNLK